MPTAPPIAMIVAMDRNGVIGNDNKLPWHLPNDLKFFKATTMGKPIIMGRHTYESIGRPLPGRCNIVITRQQDYVADGIEVCNTIEAAIDRAQRDAIEKQASEVMVIGGAAIYQMFLPMAKLLYVTRVHAAVKGDVYFPNVDQGWHEISRVDHVAGDKNPYDYSFVTLVRSS